MTDDVDAPGARPASGGDVVRALASGLAVLRAFTPDTPTLSVSEAATAAGVTRATARRMLLTLTELGYAVQDGRRFALTPRVLELGHGYWSGRSVSEILRPILTQASQRLHQSCSAGVLHGAHLMYIARVHTERILRVNLDVGTRLPAFTTSMGRVLLAGLTEPELDRVLAMSQIRTYTPHTITGIDALKRVLAGVRADGYACVAQELEPGLQSVAVPIMDRSGRVIAAMNVSGHANRYSRQEMLAAFLPPLRRAADQINHALLRR